MIVLILLVVAVGGLVEIVPLFFQKSTTEPVAGPEALHRAAARRPRHLRARGLLQLPLADDPAVPRRDQRYGHYSVAGEFVYDHPFQWGSKRTGPDLQRVGGTLQRRVAPHAPEQPARRGAGIEHAGLSVAGEDARSTPPSIAAAHAALRRVGVPYTRRRDRQGRRRRCKGKTEMDALVAYLQVARHRRSSKEEHAMDVTDPAHRRHAACRSLTFIGILGVGRARAATAAASTRRRACRSQPTTDAETAP